MKRRDLVTSIVLMALSFATLVEMKRSELPIGTASSPQVGFFPLIIVILLAILSLILLIKTIKGRTEMPAPSWGGAGGLGPLILTAGGLFVYGFFFELMGYLICTFLLVAFFVRVMGKRKLWVAITMALVSTVVSYLLFDMLLKTTLPVGILSGLLRR